MRGVVKAAAVGAGVAGGQAEHAGTAGRRPGGDSQRLGRAWPARVPVAWAASGAHRAASVHRHVLPKSARAGRHVSHKHALAGLTSSRRGLQARNKAHL